MNVNKAINFIFFNFFIFLFLSQCVYDLVHRKYTNI